MPEPSELAVLLEDRIPKPYPEGWPILHNACNDPCDMLRGPCACGAWHSGDDQATKAIVILLNEIERLQSHIQHHQTHHTFEHRACSHTVPHNA